jgi:hypothetical protein
MGYAGVQIDRCAVRHMEIGFQNIPLRFSNLAVRDRSRRVPTRATASFDLQLYFRGLRQEAHPGMAIVVADP